MVLVCQLRTTRSHFEMCQIYTNNTHILHALAEVQHASRTFTMLRTERDGFAVEFGLQNIVNVRNHVALPLMHE